MSRSLRVEYRYSVLCMYETVASINPSSGCAYAKALLAHPVCIRIRIVIDCRVSVLRTYHMYVYTQTYIDVYIGVRVLCIYNLLPWGQESHNTVEGMCIGPPRLQGELYIKFVRLPP